MDSITPDPADRFVDPDRLDKLRAIIDEQQIDGFVAFSPMNSYYLTGTYAGMYSRPVIGIVTSETSVFVGPFLEKRKAQRTSWVDSAVVYEDSDEPFRVVADAIPSVDSLGYDRAYAQPGWVEKLNQHLDANLVDATEELLKARARKTDWELDLIRRASDLATAGMKTYLDSVKAGKSELEVVREIQDAYYEKYLECHSEYDIGTANELGQYGYASVLSGGHALEPHSISSSRQISDGDSLVGIALPSLQGYVCEEERTILVGDVEDEIYNAMETLTAIRREAIDRVKPGVGTDDLDAWTINELEKRGYNDNIVHRTGHGEGITIHEGPALNARDSGTLESGMVISIEPGLYFEKKEVALRHSDTLIVTESGSEQITDTDNGLHIV